MSIYMGHTIEISSKSDPLKTVIGLIDKKLESQITQAQDLTDEYLYCETYSIGACDTIKEILTDISIMYPNTLFEVTTVNYDSPDGERWKIYFENGISELCLSEIVYEEPKEIDVSKYK